MQNLYKNKTDFKPSSCVQNNMPWDPTWSQDIEDGLSIARAFFEDCESSDETIESDDCSGSNNGRIETPPDSSPTPTSSQIPPPAEVLYLTKSNGGRDLRPTPVEGAKPWNKLTRVDSAPLDTWTIHQGDIVKVCLETDREEYAKIIEIRRLEDGRHMVVYTWLYTREEIQTEFEIDGTLPDLLQKNLDQRWPANATFRYMLSTNRTITLWDTAISRAPRDVIESLSRRFIYSTTPSKRFIWSVNNPRFNWMKKICDLEAHSSV
ncbi:hypothetical protein TMatcc_001229 [Talaromyces marneffei ATCC 18224]